MNRKTLTAQSALHGHIKAQNAEPRNKDLTSGLPTMVWPQYEVFAVDKPYIVP